MRQVFVCLVNLPYYKSVIYKYRKSPSELVIVLKILLKNMLTLVRINYKQWYDWAIIALLVILFCLLPSVSSNELMQGTMSGKMFFFLYVILIGGILIVLKFITKSSICVSFSYMDGILFLWIAYILINGWFQHIPLSNRLLELGGLVVLYILLRQIEPSIFGIILIAMVLGCIIQ